jgi:antitoxin ParD1/3/4
MNITLPDSMKAEVEAKAKAAGFPSVDAYVLDLIRFDTPEEDEVYDLPGPPHLTPRNRAELEAMLDEGMNSGNPIVVDDAFWEERKRVLAERMAKRKDGAA